LERGEDAVTSTRKKHRSGEAPTPPGGRGAVDGPRGRLPAGREVLAPLPTARRRSEEALARSGKETALDTAARIELENPHEAKVLRDWIRQDLVRIASLVSCLPRGGSSRRELRVAMCNVAFLAKRGEVVSFKRRGCKDRICPTCGARRRVRFVHRLREIVAARNGELPTAEEAVWEGEGGRARERARLIFATFTRPKKAREEVAANGKRYLVALPAVQAVDAMLGVPGFKDAAGTPIEQREQGGAWRRFLRHARGWLRGGVRSLEVTARRVGDRIGAHVVKVPGAHVHLHCILEVAPGTTHEEVRAAWRAACRGADDEGQDVQELNDDNVYQVGSYVFDTAKLLDESKVDRSYVCDVLAALHGRRLVAAFGAWRAFDLGVREPKGEVVFGGVSIYSLTTAGDDHPDEVVWADGEREPWDEALRRYLAGPREPLGGPPAAAANAPPEQEPAPPARPAGRGVVRARGPPSG